MGILNLTPDSFFDGGRYPTVPEAVDRACRMIDEGADIVDIGGESTRPGATEVDVTVEIARTLPVVAALRARSPACISIDTRKAEVARRALDAGADIINDVSALTHDPGMADVAAGSGAGVVLMHMRGQPRQMQENPQYDDVVGEVRDYLEDRLRACERAGIAREACVVDPGIGFGKTFEHNLALLAGLEALVALGRPVLVGLSRKSFLGQAVGRGAEDRLAAGLGAQVAAVMNGASILRVHDVKDTCDAIRIVDMLSERRP